MADRNIRTNNPDANPDPITKAPGSHPVGTGIGAAAAGAAGAAAGSVVPGIGTAVGGAVGAVVGAVVGGLAGKGIAEAIDPTEENYWKDEYRNRPYYRAGSSYDDVAPAYRYGYNSAANRPGQSFDDVEEDLSKNWEASRGDVNMDWKDAREATRDAYNRRYERSGAMQSGNQQLGNMGANRSV